MIDGKTKLKIENSTFKILISVFPINIICCFCIARDFFSVPLLMLLKTARESRERWKLVALT